MNPSILLPEESLPAALVTEFPVLSRSPELIVQHHPLQKRHYALLKRATDLLFASLLILAIFPWFLPLVALLIKCDSRGPVFFRQQRYKRDGRLFTCIKLRTMVCNTAADQLPAHPHDRRITRLGAFLRRHHLDELPQLFNVLAGDMAIVGPRPHMVADTALFEEWVPAYHLRHCVKPGITGLAQVSGHVGQVTSVERLRARIACDKAYIRNWSLLLDFRIACRTFFKIFTPLP